MKMTSQQIIAAYAHWTAACRVRKCEGKCGGMLYRAFHDQRFGQWFINTYFPDIHCHDVFYVENPGQALCWILERKLFNGDIE